MFFLSKNSFPFYQEIAKNLDINSLSLIVSIYETKKFNGYDKTKKFKRKYLIWIFQEFPIEKLKII